MFKVIRPLGWLLLLLWCGLFVALPYISSPLVNKIALLWANKVIFL